jgi:hypothetical protein
MSEKTVAAKMRIKPGATLALVYAPPGIGESLDLPADVTFVDELRGADHVLVFVSKRAEVEERIPATVKAIGPTTDYWVIFRKGSKAAGLDMSRDTIWEVASALGMRPLGVITVNDAWAGFHLKKPAQ